MTKPAQAKLLIDLYRAMFAVTGNRRTAYWVPIDVIRVAPGGDD